MSKKGANHFCAAKLLQLCESLMAGAESRLISIGFTFSFFIGTLSLLTALMWEMNVGVAFEMLDCDTIEENSFLFATSLIELKVLLNQGGQLFFAVLSSTSVALSWCVKFCKDKNSRDFLSLYAMLPNSEQILYLRKNVHLAMNYYLK